MNFWGAPARAQVSGVIAVQNDDRFRGRSVSEGEPVAIASIQYDLESGVSIGASAVGTTNGSGDNSDSDLSGGLLRASGHVGYARSLGRNLAVDGGVVVQTYTDRYSSGRSQTFVEIFGGVTFGPVALHASYSPSYLDAGLETLYVEVNAVQELGSGFRATARAGLLNRLSGEGSLGGENTRWDAQIGLTKDFDRLTLYANVGTAGSGQGTYFDGPWQGRDAVVVGISRSF
ncbi:MAG: TorF family putative porin [Pseudomonadota bacterium]